MHRRGLLAQHYRDRYLSYSPQKAVLRGALSNSAVRRARRALVNLEDARLDAASDVQRGGAIQVVPRVGIHVLEEAI